MKLCKFCDGNSGNKDRRLRSKHMGQSRLFQLTYFVMHNLCPKCFCNTLMKTSNCC